MNEDNLDLLDLENDDAMDTLPDAPVFAAPRPKKPWLLLGLGLATIVLMTYIIVRAVGDDSSSSIEVNLDAPVIVDDGADAPLVPGTPTTSQPETVAVPVVEKTVVAAPGVPVRVVEDRKDVKFNPDAVPVVEKPAPAPVVQKPVVQPAAKQASKPAVQPAAKPAAQKVAPKPVVVKTSSWYVQFGSYSTRALAESAQRQISNAHRSLFNGKQFVILAAVLPNGKTTYRLRVGFDTASAANGFCQNAKSDGLDCYVAK